MLEDIVIKSITGVSSVYSKKGFSEIKKNRANYGLSFCKSGKITYIQDGKKYVSDETCAVILPKGATYKIVRQETGSFPVINFECDHFFTDRFLLFPVRNPQVLINLFQTLSVHFYYREKLEAKAVLYKILAQISKNGKTENVSRAVNYIYENAGDPSLTNRAIADYLKISETYLNKQFLKSNGTTPKKFIQKVRMENAVRLLSEDSASIGEIAELCGYSSIYSFSRAFKNLSGKSPAEYRKNIRSDSL